MIVALIDIYLQFIFYVGLLNHFPISCDRYLECEGRCFDGHVRVWQRCWLFSLQSAALPRVQWVQRTRADGIVGDSFMFRK